MPPLWWDPSPCPKEGTTSWWAPVGTYLWGGQTNLVSPVPLGTLWTTSPRSTEMPPPWWDLSPCPQGGDNVMVGTHGDITTEGTEEPGVTGDPRATLGDVTMVYRGDMTTVGDVTVSQGGDNVMVGTHGDVAMGGTDQPGVTSDPGDTLGHVTEVYRDATTVVQHVTMSQGGDNVMVGTHRDVAMEGMEEPDVTEDPGDTLGHATEVYRDATTVAGPIATSQGGDNVMVGTHGDITMEGTEEPGVTEDPGATLGDVTMVYRGDTTTVGPVTVSQRGDKAVVAQGGDVLVEGTEGPAVTGCSGDVTAAYRGDRTTVGPVTVSQGCDTAVVAHGGDVLVEGTEGPGVTEDPRDTLGHATEVYRDATTVAGPIATSQGGDNVMVATHGDITMEGTEEPGVTEDPRDTLDHITEVYRDATTVVGHVTMSQGGDNVMVGTHGMSPWREQKNLVSLKTPEPRWAMSPWSIEGTRPQWDPSPCPNEGTKLWWPMVGTSSWRGPRVPLSPAALGTSPQPTEGTGPRWDP
ncbi:uncharacterized protein ACIBXB_003072 [Morphnus guianensis]